MAQIYREPPCISEIVKELKPNSDKRKAQFLLAYLYYLEQSRITDYNTIREKIEYLSAIRQEQSDYAKRNDFFYFRKKKHYFSDRNSFVRFRNMLIEVAAEQLSFRELLRLQDKKLGLCHNCPYKNSYRDTLKEQKQLLGLLTVHTAETKSILWDSENNILNRQHLSDITDIEEIFSHFTSIADIFPNAQKGYYPLYACYAKAVLSSDTYIMSGFLFDLFAYCEKAFAEELKKAGITQKVCGNEPSYIHTIFEYLSNLGVAALHEEDAKNISSFCMELLQNIQKKESYQSAWDIDATPAYELSEEINIPIAKTLETQQMDVFQGIVNASELEEPVGVETISEQDSISFDTLFISNEERFFFPYLLKEEEILQYQDISNEPSLIDKVCSTSENSGYLYASCAIVNEHQVFLFLQIKKQLYRLLCTEHDTIKRIFLNKKIMVFSSSPYAIYTALLWCGLSLRECIFPILEFLDDTFPYEKLEYHLSDSSYYTSFLEENISAFLSKKDTYLPLCKLHYFYSFSYFRERYFSCDRKLCSPFLVWYDVENHHSYLQKFDLAGVSAKCSGKILCCELESKMSSDFTNEISNIIDALLILLVDRGDVRLRYITLVERGEHYIKFFSPSYVCEYFSTHIITDLLRLGKEFHVPELQVRFTSEEIIKRVESGK